MFIQGFSINQFLHYKCYNKFYRVNQHVLIKNKVTHSPGFYSGTDKVCINSGCDDNHQIHGPSTKSHLKKMGGGAKFKNSLIGQVRH